MDKDQQVFCTLTLYLAATLKRQRLGKEVIISSSPENLRVWRILLLHRQTLLVTVNWTPDGNNTELWIKICGIAYVFQVVLITVLHFRLSYCPITTLLRIFAEHVRNRAVELVGRAYTSIRADDFAQLVGMSVEEAVSLAQGHNWGYDEPTCMILPVPQTPQPHAPTPSEEQLRRLADYVSFLEN